MKILRSATLYSIVFAAIFGSLRHYYLKYDEPRRQERVSAAVEAGDLNRAQGTLIFKTDPNYLDNTYQNSLLPILKRESLSEEEIKKVKIVIGWMPKDETKDTFLKWLAAIVMSKNDGHESIDLLAQMTVLESKYAALTEFGENYARARNYQAAWNTLCCIDDENLETVVDRNIRIDSFISTTKIVMDNNDYFDAFDFIAPIAASAGDKPTEQLDELLEKIFYGLIDDKDFKTARLCASIVTNPELKYRLIAEDAVFYAKNSEYKLAVDTAAFCEDEAHPEIAANYKKNALIDIVKTAILAKDWDQALLRVGTLDPKKEEGQAKEELSKIKNSLIKDIYLGHLEDENYKQANIVCGAIDDPYIQFDLLKYQADLRMKKGDLQGAFYTTIIFPNTIPDVNDTRDIFRRDIDRRYLTLGIIDIPEEQMSTILAKKFRYEIIVRVAAAYAQLGDPDMAIKTIAKVDGKELRARFLTWMTNSYHT